MSAPATRTPARWGVQLSRRWATARAAVVRWWAARVTRTRLQVATELGGYASFVTAGFLGSTIVGCCVLGAVLVFLGNGRW